MPVLTASNIAVFDQTDHFEFLLSTNKKRTAFQFVTDGGQGQDGTIIFMGGSGCRSLAYSKIWFAKLSGSYRVLSLDKVGVARGKFTESNCSEEFIRSNLLSSYGNDITEFANSMFEKYPTRRRILSGVSEGGAIAAVIAQRIPRLTHIVLFSIGGGTGEDEIQAQSYLYGGENARLTGKLRYDKIVAQSDNTFRIDGIWSVGYIKEFIHQDHLIALRDSKLNILVAHGGLDRVVLTQLAKRACEQLTPTQNRITFYYEPLGDHGLQTPDNKSGYWFFAAFRSWLEMQNSPLLSSNCPY